MATIKPKAAPLRTWRDELPMLARPAAILLGIAIGASLFVGASGVYCADQRDGLAQAERIRAQSAAKLRNVETEKHDLALYRARFAELQALGVVGAENRLGWIEAVRQIQARRKLITATYEVDPQQALAVPGTSPGMQLRGAQRQRIEGREKLLAQLHRIEIGLQHVGRRAVEPP